MQIEKERLGAGSDYRLSGWTEMVVGLRERCAGWEAVMFGCR